MNIRKADSKGRLTGFEPGTHYEVTTPEGWNTVVLRKLAEGGYTVAGPFLGTVHEGEFHTPKGYEKGYD